MLDAFLHFIRKEQLLQPGSRVLLAVSGGVDSVVMAHLFLQAGWRFGIAHCNFKLRGRESDEDERFVQALANAWKVPFFSVSFDTIQAARQPGVSVQMAARELRYQWLEDIRREKGYDYTATAHHLNDSIETAFYNLVKGCGIRGLHGIPLRSGQVVRPLLFACRADIEAYAAAHYLGFRQDASNAEDKYHRNKIRLRALPALRGINPALEETMAANLERFKEAEYLYEQALKMLRRGLVKEARGRLLISVGGLKQHEPAIATILYEWLSPLGFNAAQARQMAQSLENTGATFYAPPYRLLVDREYLAIEKMPEEEGTVEYRLEEKNQDMELPGGRFSMRRHSGRVVLFSTDASEAALDAGALEFPLRLRRWREGDVFQPLGMGGRHQKVQDFFTNNKVSRFDKEQAWILEDGQGRICWLVGYRIDDRFAIKPGTAAYWVLKYEKV